jgi:hypothetical protein
VNKPVFSFLHTLRRAPYGGGNQFLLALKGALTEMGQFSDVPDEADVILFNGHHDLEWVSKVRAELADKPFLHRVDGPMCLYNDPSDKRDSRVIVANRLFADGTVFQSNWSLNENERLGWPRSPNQVVISNAPDPAIFYSDPTRCPLSGGRVRLIATSWSSNLNKGFDVYDTLDATLDFDRYDMTFIGNASRSFKNIVHRPPMDSAELAGALRESDIFITASRNDPCSNSLIEALNCGLPAIAANDGGHPEILRSGGELFDSPEEIPELIERICESYQGYLEKLGTPTIRDIAEEYTAFAARLLDEQAAGRLKPKSIGVFQKMIFKFLNR